MTELAPLDFPTITALDCGGLTTQERTIIDGGSTDDYRLPIPAWLIRHPGGGIAVFDAGLHPSLADGSDGLGPLARIFTPDLGPESTVGARLSEHDVDPAGRFDVIVSHCHFDHVGGLCELGNARLVVHADEWREALAAPGGGFDPSLYDLGHDVLTVDGVHDVFGDGSVTTLPTPGHTCGHQSLRVITADGPTILTSDACYFLHTLDDDVLPPFGYDLDQQRRSLALLRAERDRGTRIIPGHDATVIEPLYPA